MTSSAAAQACESRFHPPRSVSRVRSVAVARGMASVRVAMPSHTYRPAGRAAAKGRGRTGMQSVLPAALPAQQAVVAADSDQTSPNISTTLPSLSAPGNVDTRALEQPRRQRVSSKNRHIVAASPRPSTPPIFTSPILPLLLLSLASSFASLPADRLLLPCSPARHIFRSANPPPPSTPSPFLAITFHSRQYTCFSAFADRS